MRSLIKFTVDQFLDTGFHIGSVKYNMNTYSYILGQRGNIFLFDLEQSLYLLKRALSFVESVTAKKGSILFVAVTPSRSLQRFTYSLASYSFQTSYAVSRWEGGFLSNWRKITVSRWRIFKDQNFLKMQLSNVKRRKLKNLFYFFMSLRRKLVFSKKEIVSFGLHFSPLVKQNKLYYPSAVFLYNPLNISFPVLEIFKVGLPLIGVVDSDNIYSSKYMFPIPGNDDSAISYRFISYLVAYSALRGVQQRRKMFWKEITDSIILRKRNS